MPQPGGKSSDRATDAQASPVLRDIRADIKNCEYLARIKKRHGFHGLHRFKEEFHKSVTICRIRGVFAFEIHSQLLMTVFIVHMIQPFTRCGAFFCRHNSIDEALLSLNSSSAYSPSGLERVHVCCAEAGIQNTLPAASGLAAEVCSPTRVHFYGYTAADVLARAAYLTRIVSMASLSSGIRL